MSRYIDADILKNKTTRVNHIWNSTTNAEGKGLDEIIDDIPTADVRENVRGEWILTGEIEEVRAEVTKCSVCGCETWGGGHFCCGCGADMRGDNQ